MRRAGEISEALRLLVPWPLHWLRPGAARIRAQNAGLRRCAARTDIGGESPVAGADLDEIDRRIAWRRAAISASCLSSSSPNSGPTSTLVKNRPRGRIVEARGRSNRIRDRRGQIHERGDRDRAAFTNQFGDLCAESAIPSPEPPALFLANGHECARSRRARRAAGRFGRPRLSASSRLGFSGASRRTFR